MRRRGTRSAAPRRLTGRLRAQPAQPATRARRAVLGAREERLWYHCRLSLYSFAVQKVFSIVLFVYLINSDSVMRGLHDITLEQHSAVRTLFSAMRLRDIIIRFLLD